MAGFLLFIKGVGAKIWAGVLVAFAFLAAIAVIFRAGQQNERGKAAERDAEVKDDQLGVVRPNTDRELRDKLHNGKF